MPAGPLSLELSGVLSLSHQLHGQSVQPAAAVLPALLRSVSEVRWWCRFVALVGLLLLIRVASPDPYYDRIPETCALAKVGRHPAPLVKRVLVSSD